MDELTPWWTVCGVWVDSRERWSDHYQALTPRMAEDLAQVDARAAGGRLWVTNVFAGKIKPVDWAYAKFVDPDAIDPNALDDP